MKRLAFILISLSTILPAQVTITSHVVLDKNLLPDVFGQGRGKIDDTPHFTAWGPPSSNGNYQGGLLIGTCNDCTNRNITMLGVPGITTNGIGLDNTANVVNDMLDYPRTGAVACWNKPDYPQTYACKTYDPFYLNGILYVNIVDFLQTTPYPAFQSTMIMSPDNGQHWCNNYTYAVGVGGTPNLCNSSNWSAGGDMNLDNTHLLWPTVNSDNVNSMGRLTLIQMCQDNTINCPVIPGLDPSRYMYFGSVGAVAFNYMHRLDKNCTGTGVGSAKPMHTECWTHWDGSAWNADYLTSVNLPIQLSGTMYSKYSHKFYTFNGDMNTLTYAYSDSIFGPWTTGTFDCSAFGTAGSSTVGCSGDFATPILPTLYYDTRLKADVFTVVADNTYTYGEGFYFSVAFGYNEAPSEDTPIFPSATTSSGLFPLPLPIQHGGAVPTLTNLVSNTQAVITYQAPSSSACTVEVSEKSDFSTLVHDVDPTLFSGSNSDFRSEAIHNGTFRLFTIGKRVPDKADDGVTWYSRALQAATTHYWRACGGTASGSFTTTNVPGGNTRAELPMPDPSTPTKFKFPTAIEDRNQTIIEPTSGVLLHRVTLLSDQKTGDSRSGQCADSGSPSCGLYMGSGGFSPFCTTKVQTAGDGAQGYVCAFGQLDDGTFTVFFYVTATGEWRRVGFTGQTPNNDLETFVIPDSGPDAGKVFKHQYVGDLSAMTGAPNELWATDAGVLYNDVATGDLVRAFDPTFPSDWGCGQIIAAARQDVYIGCNGPGMVGQDNHGWIAVANGGDGRAASLTCTAGDDCVHIKAVYNVSAAPASRWCAIHEHIFVGDIKLTSINFQELKYGTPYSGNLGTLPFITTVVGNWPAGSSTITLASKTFTNSHPDDHTVQDVAVGDTLGVGLGSGGGYDQRIRITSLTPIGGGQYSAGITYLDTPADITTGTTVWGLCQNLGGIGYWKYELDPHATDTTNTNLILDNHSGFDPGGHMFMTSVIKGTESGAGWSVIHGNPFDTIGQAPLNFQDTRYFAGQRGLGYGNHTAKHPSFTQDPAQAPVDTNWITDLTVFTGGSDFSGTGAVNITGQLWSYPKAVYPATAGPGTRKTLEFIAAQGDKAMVDISGPSSVLCSDSSCSYQWCTAVLANECHTGSTPGDIFFNVPQLDYASCTVADFPLSEIKDMCITPASTYSGAAVQIRVDVDPDTSTTLSRVLTYGMDPIRGSFGLPSFKATPDAKWIVWNRGLESTGHVMVWAAKNPPAWVADGIDRGNWVPGTVYIHTPTGLGIATAEVEFGYLDYGTAAQHYCTTRREACVVNNLNQSVHYGASNPFFYSSEPHSKTLCSVGCSIHIPLQPLKLAYYTVKFYDATGTFVQNGQSGVLHEGKEIH